MTKLVVLFEILRTRLKSGEVADIQFENMFYCLCCVLHSKTRKTRSQSVLHVHTYIIFKQNSVEINTYYGGSLKIHVLQHCVNCARLYDRLRCYGSSDSSAGNECWNSFIVASDVANSSTGFPVLMEHLRYVASRYSF
jgi:hypothetical protein